MAEKKTTIQQLSDLVEWFLGDKKVELKFVPNPRRLGRFAPEYNFEYWLDDRRITDRSLAMQIMVELGRRNYEYTIGKVVAALNEHSWRYYIENHEYPDHLRGELTPIVKRPVGRPRLRPLQITLSELQKHTKKLSRRTQIEIADTIQAGQELNNGSQEFQE